MSEANYGEFDPVVIVTTGIDPNAPENKDANFDSAMQWLIDMGLRDE